MDLRSRRIGEDESSTVIRKISAALTTVENTWGSKNKVILVRKLFQYMMTIPTFLRENKRFRLTTIAKSAEFRCDPSASKLLPLLNRYDRYIRNISESPEVATAVLPKRHRTPSPVLRRSTRLKITSNAPSAPSAPIVGDTVFYQGFASSGGEYEFNMTDMEWSGYNANGSSHWIVPDRAL